MKKMYIDYWVSGFNYTSPKIDWNQGLFNYLKQLFTSCILVSLINKKKKTNLYF